MSNNLDHTGKQPDMINIIGANSKGIKKFFTAKEEAYLTKTGRELSETLLQEDFVFYKIDLKRTKTNRYGESKEKRYEKEVVVNGRINVEAVENMYHEDGGLLKKGFGIFNAHCYIEHLEELGLVEFNEGQRLVFHIKEGDFIGFKGQFYEIKDNGSQMINNQSSHAGDRRFATTIKAVEVGEQIFRAR